MKRLLLTLIVLVAALAPGAAWSHAALLESDPADGQVLPSAPGMVHLRFNEPVRPLVVTLFDAAGGTHRDLAVERHDEMVMVRMPSALGVGSHVLSYRVISTDGHPVAGSLTFSVGEPGAATGQPDLVGGPGFLLWLSRLVLYAGLFVGVGGAFFRAWLAPDLEDRSLRVILFSTLAAGSLSALAALGFQGLDALGRPLADLTSGEVWRVGLDTTYGHTVIIALLALAAAAASLGGWAPRSSSVAALLGAGLALAASGHASSASPQWLTRPAVMIHGVAVAYWVGALAPLVFLLRRRGPDIPKMVRRFSSGAVLAVSALVLTGAVLAVIQVQHPSALLATEYGLILSLKLTLVAALLVLAGINRYRLTPALGRDGSAGRKLSALVLAELTLAGCIFGLVGLWRFTPPPRSTPIEQPSEQPAFAHIHGPQGMAEVRLTPGQAGPNRIRIAIAGPSGPLDPKEVTLRLANKTVGIEPIERRATRATDGAWMVEGIVLPVAGLWSLEVDALISDFDQTTLAGEVEIRP
jgi:copper transport protein